ncbi:DUF4234 domain-containing protein [Halopseudomonas pelagia]|uniref:DUF4234 domain-containing protein n=1 Tax=Halopseudomonas pelagia TaxID=553151 RepID=UPI0003A79FC9|nr:DUF4234 domain-containing protein [Halopseudomonas pelagia]
MNTIHDLPTAVSTKTLNLVLLSLATLGVYPVIWLYLNTPKLEQVTGKAIASGTFLIWLAVCLGWSGTLSTLGEEWAEVIAGLLSIAGCVLYIVWAFKARAALQDYALHEHKIDLKMNVFYTVLFTVFYINYCVNALPEAQRKQQILSGQPV